MDFIYAIAYLALRNYSLHFLFSRAQQLKLLLRKDNVVIGDLLLRKLAEFPIYQIPEHISVYRAHKLRSFDLLPDQPNSDALIENNIAGSKDLFDYFEAELGAYLGDELSSSLISINYMYHAAEALVAGKLRAPMKCFRRALVYYPRIIIANSMSVPCQGYH